jgi:hypothetical protein
MTPALRPEARLLIACARTRLDAERQALIRALVAETGDWDYLVRKAEEHGLVPLLYRSLTTICTEAVPGPVMERLRSRVRANTFRAMLLSAELIRLLKAFDTAGIDAIPLKGPTLAVAGYYDVALREYGDLDILVRPLDVAKAARSLIERGYHAEIDLTGPQLSLALRSAGEQTFRRANGPMVELHWSLLPRRLPVMMEFDSLRERVTTVEVNGCPVRSLGTEDLLLFLFVHGGKHLWSSLGGVCDVAQVIEATGEIRWAEIARRAAAHHCLRMLHLGASLVFALFSAPVPLELRGRAEALSGEIIARIFAEEPAGLGLWAGYRAQAGLVDTIADKIRYWRIFLSPTLAEWLSMPLPRPLFFLYYPLRPLRLLGRSALRFLRRAF